MHLSLIIYLASVPFFFLLDSTSAHYFEQPFLYSLLCFTILVLFQNNKRLSTLYPLFLLSIQSVIFYDKLGLNLIYTLPVLIVGWIIKKNGTSKTFGIFVTSSIALLTQAVFTFYYFKSISIGQGLSLLGHITSPYTIISFSANLLVLYMSLKFLPTEKRDNRF
jgi:hypothetical protein